MTLQTQHPTWQQQADAVISQANPVSTTLYTVLAVTANVRILSISASVTWAVTQPNPLEIVVTIDGNTIIYIVTNPISATVYSPFTSIALQSFTAALQEAIEAYDATHLMPFPIEGKSVLIQIRVTWAVTQPTPLVCRVKYEALR